MSKMARSGLATIVATCELSVELLRWHYCCCLPVATIARLSMYLCLCERDGQVQVQVRQSFTLQGHDLRCGLGKYEPINTIIDRQTGRDYMLQSSRGLKSSSLSRFPNSLTFRSFLPVPHHFYVCLRWRLCLELATHGCFHLRVYKWQNYQSSQQFV